MSAPEGEDLSRNAVIKAIRTALRQRSGKDWSVTGGRGTAWGWITIEAPPRRREANGCMSEADRAELARLLGFAEPVHQQGVHIPSSHDYYREHLNRARLGHDGGVSGAPYWD